MQPSRPALIGSSLVVLAFIGAGLWWSTTKNADVPVPATTRATATTTVAPPVGSVPGTTSTPEVEPPVVVANPALPNHSTVPPILLPPKVSPPPLESAPAAPANPAALALADAHRTGEGAEATSPLLAPTPFEPESFAKDPVPYLHRSVPGRVFQTAQPGPTVPVLGARGPATHEVAHGGTCDLMVRAPAGAPVTFTTFDLGLFDNGLASITVQATADGVATARFNAVGEVSGDIHLLAGSPMASGQVKFLVGVLPPAPRVSQTN